MAWPYDICKHCGNMVGNCFCDTPTGRKWRAKRTLESFMAAVADLVSELNEERVSPEEPAAAKDKPKYLPCPFCGGEQTKFIACTSVFVHSVQVVCRSCWTQGPVGSGNDGAIEAWNKRV